MVEPGQASEQHLQEVIAMIGKALTNYLIETWSVSPSLFSFSPLYHCLCAASPIAEIARLKYLREEVVKDISAYRETVR
jgi:hypothetical protein